MQDSDVVAAIVAGDPDGVAEAYDRHAVALYAYCRAMLPAPDAADAVQDTFVIATSKLDGLRDPAGLGRWLHAVARNECLRRGAQVPDGDVPEVPLPDGLREQVLAACTDSTPAGRAYRVGVAYHAGAFGRSGFPKRAKPAVPAVLAGPRWWRGVRRHPRAALAVALAVTAAAVIPAVTLGGPHQAQAASFPLGGGVPQDAAGMPAGAPPGIPGSSSPARTKSGRVARSAPAVKGTASRAALAGPATHPGTPGPQAAAPPSTSPAPPPSSQAPPPSQGSLQVAPAQLVLVPGKGKGKDKTLGTFVLTAVGGPVSGYTITVPPDVSGRVKVTPSSGSLPAGGQVTVTVTVSGKAALEADLIVSPGALTVTVLLASGN